ncbi:MAG: hypothetical protein LQ337_001364 [Flavoplaca oasis]|nr:MAG: hypothetical protein LQ337_001364 [Flavoplaca oasis]
MFLNLRLTALAIAVAPAWARVRVAPRGSPLPSPTNAFGAPIGGASDLPEPTSAPDFANRAKAFAGFDGDRLTVRITNAFGWDLPISYQSNRGSPTIIGNPSTNTFLAGSNTQVVVTRNFAGAIFIGKSFDPANSKIEISFSPPQNYRPGVDVSYVDGYSVPITCSCGGVPVTGCNIPLFLQGRTCPQPGPGDKVICYNPKKVINNGPADPFFQPCQGAAYTYPNDHTANAFGKCDSGDIQCCVGISCPRPGQQHGKRDLEDWGFGNETEIPAGIS